MRWDKPRPLSQSSVGGHFMFGNSTAVSSIVEIKQSYPDEWVAIAVPKD